MFSLDLADCFFTDGLRLKVKLGEVLKEVTLTELSLSEFLKTGQFKVRADFTCC